ncbi:PHP domain-containing protein [Galactobacter caseinivorans]|uniref:PHP domain-containing protein n=1 Tax=Galactobacter caseinivorans TaxID=2676123 RepID=A0A496PM36_9MICC|nr:PHP domain-containing protein [Galactobacter caseinivorans]RKW71601.1 PHP domain-containing protein [Galactobacter caseinivorans]
MRIDLHTHSWVSDGTQSPADLVDSAAAAGVDIVALTDHDQMNGWAQAQERALALGLGWVGGMEVTCRMPASGISVHMLCYLPDPLSPELLSRLAELRYSRDHRARAMVERLAEDFPIDWAQVVGQTQDGATIGRPHIADALVAARVVQDRTEAFASILSARTKYYVGTDALDPHEAVRVIHDAGGVAIMAHPVAAERGRVISQREMLSVVEAGLDGVEVYHRDNSPAGRKQLLALAAEHDLIVTGSSDYHGAGKPNLLAENTTAPDQLARIIEAAGTENYAGFTLEDLRRAG